MTHVDHWLDEPPRDWREAYAKFVLEAARAPAVVRMQAKRRRFSCNRHPPDVRSCDAEAILAVWTTLAVTPFDARKVYDVAAELGVWQALLYEGGPHRFSPEEAVAPMRRLGKLLAFAEEHQLPTSPGLIQSHIDRIAAPPFGSVTNHQCGDMARECNRRVADELGQLFILRLDPGESAQFLSEAPFGHAVGTAFPSVADDIREAARCYACGRYTAAVFHASRALEVALTVLATHLRVPHRRPGWKNILDQLDKRVRELDARTKGPIVRERLRFAAAALAYLRGVKDAWRNEQAHDVAKHYDEPQAIAILTSVRLFLTHLATRLHEPQRRGRKRGG